VGRRISQRYGSQLFGIDNPIYMEHKQLKRIQLDANTQIFVLPHVDEAAVIEKFKNRHDRADWHTIGRMSNDYGKRQNVSSKGYGSDY